MNLLNSFKFERPGENIYSEDGKKVKSYKTVFVVASHEHLAREKARLTDDYQLIEATPLGRYWNIQ